MSDIHYKMVVVVAHCRTAIVPKSSLQDGFGGGPLQKGHGGNLHYKMVMVVAPCRTDMVPISTTRW